MKKIILPASALMLGFLLIATSIPVFAASNPWLGTWKLNRDKSTFTGTTQTVSKTPKGYLFTIGTLKFEVGDDGMDYPTVTPDAYSLKQIGKNEWFGVSKSSGKEISRDTMKLSDDGKSMTDKTTGTHADGTTYCSEETDLRVGPGTGLAGTWKSTKVSSTSPDTLVISHAGGGRFKYYNPARKGGYVLALDGKPVPFFGPQSSPSQTIGVRSVSPLQEKLVVYLDGKPFVEGTDTISAGGKAMKSTSWPVGSPQKKPSPSMKCNNLDEQWLVLEGLGLQARSPPA